MDSFYLLLVALLAMDCTGVHGKLMFYGEGVLNVNQQEFINQIFPKPGTNKRKYVRIRTFNDKYIFAYATDSGDNSYLRTRCCGAKDAVGRSDVKVPGRRTTFLIHCQRIGNENTFKFEILNGKNNNPSGYYFYADLDWAQYGIWAEEYTDDPDSVYFEFVLHRWRGPVIGIRTYRPGTYPSNWVTFGESRNSDGRVTAFRNLVYDKKNSLPNFADTYTLEAVPSGCVGGASQRNVVWAAPAGTEHEECESKPDRCYWTDGWYVGRRRWLPGTCYYNKDSMCWWERGSRAQVPAARKCIVNGATIPDDSGTCEAANCCFDYKKNQCYKPL